MLTKLPSKIRCHYRDPGAIAQLSHALAQYLEEYNPYLTRPVVVIGIGTDRSTGDSLGPLVGTNLARVAGDSFFVYGTLEEPVHAGNLKETIAKINSSHPGAFVIAADASLGVTENVGVITLAAGSLKPGAGVNKDLPPIGDIYFTGTVNVGGYMEFFVLQNTRLSLVMEMADKIAAAIWTGYRLAATGEKQVQLAYT